MPRSPRDTHFRQTPGSSIKPIGERLVEAGLITHDQLRQALELQKRQGKKLADTLILLGHITPKAFVSFLARQPGVPSIDLLNCEIHRELTELVPRELAVKHELFPIDRLGKLLTLGMVCPLDVRAIAELEKHTGLKVKPLLCSAGDIHAAIRRYYGDEAGFGDVEDTSEYAIGDDRAAPLRPRNVRALVRGLRSLPTLSRTAQWARVSAGDPSVSVGDAVEVVAEDPIAAAKVLSMANSSSLGFPGRVTGVEQAVNLLGLGGTYSAVLSGESADLLNSASGFDYGSFWVESMFCATAARVVARACGSSHDRAAFSAGLLRDIGRVALVQVAPELYARVSADLKGVDLLPAEEEFVGLAHSEAGYELAVNWALPGEIAEAIRFHHQPERASNSPEVVAAVAIAEVLTHRRVADQAEAEKVVGEYGSFFKLLGLDGSAASKIVGEIIMVEQTRFLWKRKLEAIISNARP